MAWRRPPPKIAGSDLKSFFDRAIRSTDELDTSVLEHVGLRLRTRIRESVGDKGGTPPRLKEGDTRARGWTGIVARGNTIASVLEGSPAQAAGLYPDDEVIAVDGVKGDAASAGLARGRTDSRERCCECPSSGVNSCSRCPSRSSGGPRTPSGSLPRVADRRPARRVRAVGRRTSRRRA